MFKVITEIQGISVVRYGIRQKRAGCGSKRARGGILVVLELFNILTVAVDT